MVLSKITENFQFFQKMNEFFLGEKTQIPKIFDFSFCAIAQFYRFFDVSRKISEKNLFQPNAKKNKFIYFKDLKWQKSWNRWFCVHTQKNMAGPTQIHFLRAEMIFPSKMQIFRKNQAKKNEGEFFFGTSTFFYVKKKYGKKNRKIRPFWVP